MSAALYGRDSAGVTRQIKKLYANVGGVNRELKELWARDSGGVNRKIFSNLSWTALYGGAAQPKPNYTLYSDFSEGGSIAKVTYTLNGNDVLIATGGHFNVGVGEPLSDNATTLLKINWIAYDENDSAVLANHFYMETGVVYMQKYWSESDEYRIHKFECELEWANYGRARNWLDAYIATTNQGTVWVNAG